MKTSQIEKLIKKIDDYSLEKNEVSSKVGTKVASFCVIRTSMVLFHLVRKKSAGQSRTLGNASR